MSKILKLSLVLSIFLNFYFYNKPAKVRHVGEKCPTLKPFKNHQAQAKNSLPKTNEQGQVMPGVDQSQNPNLVFNYTDEEIAETIQKFEQEYQVEVKTLFLDKMKLSPEIAEQYFELQKARQEEMNQFYTKKYEEPGFDPEDAYFSSAEDEVARAKITEKYLNRLKSLIGVEGYNTLKNFKKEYLKKAHENNRLFHLIEF